jgi:hypothetical protein
VTAGSGQLLPARGQLLQHRFHGEHCDRCNRGSAVRYQVSSQVEVLPAEIFLHVHEELLADGRKRGLLHHFAPPHRLALSALGRIDIDAGCGYLSLATFHTFPDELTVVKTQSLIERPG